ncbi:pyruvate decarboxylase [Xylogone sp. PMI_703]|nr:pyruvate decarboxylase [Xylogone sp. PMI_703]
MAETVSVGTYIFKRIAQLGVRHIFGVPGDFNLTFLDKVYEVPELTWLGCCNELNGAYAADGYTRIRGLPAALVTTYAVGELSALNGVAGSYAEHAGFIHLVGMPARPLQKGRIMMHHTFKKDMDHAVYISMAEPVSKDRAWLMEDATMADDIDRVIVECVRSKLPVYIYVPVDVVDVKLDASRLNTPLDTSIKNADAATEDKIVKSVLELIKAAKNPVILGDVLTQRHGGEALIRKLADLTRFQSFAAPMSKGIFDEALPYYGGVYGGTASFPGVRELVENSDLVLNVGLLPSSGNTAGFSRDIKDENLVILGVENAHIHGEKFENMHFFPILKRLVVELEQNPSSYNIPRALTKAKPEPPVLDSRTSGQITQAYCWQRLGKYLQPNDILIVDSGTSQFGVPDATFPENLSYHTQLFWSSIGFSVGCTLGALVAAEELATSNPSAPKRRVVNIVGEGALQMTVQELGTMIRFGLHPVIFVINNNGYSVERAIWGPKQGYNDISMLWDHQKLLEVFGARPETGIKSRSYKCDTVESLEKVLTDPEFVKSDCIQLCEIVMDQFDYPWRIKKQLVNVRQRFKEYAEQYK